MEQQRGTVTIANGQSLSGEIDISDQCVVGIIMPAAWTAASITLAGAAAKAGTFVPVYDAAGTELTITADASRFIALAPDATRGVRYLKVRSGTNAAAVAQGAERILTLVTLPTGS